MGLALVEDDDAPEYFEDLLPEELVEIEEFMDAWTLWVDTRNEGKVKINSRRAKVNSNVLKRCLRDYGLKAALIAMNSAANGGWIGIHITEEAKKAKDKGRVIRPEHKVFKARKK